MDWKELLTRPNPKDQLILFYGEERALVRNVCLYLEEGIERGDQMVVIATAAHARLLLDRLVEAGRDPQAQVCSGRLQFLDARQTLSEIMVQEEPQWSLFDQGIGAPLRQAKERAGRSAVRAYSELVDLLWKAGRLGAAAKTESFWNRLLKSLSFGLFCASTVDLPTAGSQGPALQEVISTHSQLLPLHSGGELDRVVRQAMLEILGERSVSDLAPLIQANLFSRAVIPEAERAILWLRNNLPPYADQVLARARFYYEQCPEPRPGKGPS